MDLQKEITGFVIEQVDLLFMMVKCFSSRVKEADIIILLAVGYIWDGNIFVKNQHISGIIDWEAAGYINPFQELLEVLNYWTPDEKEDNQKAKLEIMLQAYTESVDIRNVDWKPVFAGSFDGMLGWLEYNVKRALSMEGMAADECQEGMKHTKETVLELQKYEQNVKQLNDWISEKRQRKREYIYHPPTNRRGR